MVHNLVKHEDKKRKRFEELGIKYEFPGFSSMIPKGEVKKTKKTKKPKVK